MSVRFRYPSISCVKEQGLDQYFLLIQVVTGAVKSNIVKPNTIPENSLYKPMESLYQEKRILRSQSMLFVPPA